MERRSCLPVIEENGEFYKEFRKKQCPIYIYGKTLDGKAFAQFLMANNYPFIGVVDKNACCGEKSDYSEITVSDIPTDKEHYYLIAAKSDTVASEMIQTLESVNVKGKIFTWKAFCIDTARLRGGYCSNYDFAMSVPWMYYSIYGNSVDKKLIKDIYSPQTNLYVNSRNYIHLEPYSSKYWNIDNEGRRFTCEQPQCKNSIHFFGDSRILGLGVSDEQTIPSCLQRIINITDEIEYRVHNYSLMGTTIDNLFMWLKNVEIIPGDIVFIAAKSFVICEKDKEILRDVDESEFYKYYLNKIIKYCESVNAKFYFLFMGRCTDAKENTLAEKTIKTVIKEEDSEAYGIYRDIKSLKDCYQGIFYDMRDIVDDNHLQTNFYIDKNHYTAMGCEIIAQAIYDIVFGKRVICGNVNKYEEIDAYLQRNRIRRKYPFLWSDSWRAYHEYLNKNKYKVNGKVGAIVMNANPFTKGHKYLVEYASQQVDCLYVFVVQEDASQFCFIDRYEMVKLGTDEYENVTVLKSGEYIVSKETFPEYFDSSIKEVGCAKDLEIFSSIIAPVLEINVRFVGIEPYSVTTNNYNLQMKKILPRYGIEVREIQRLAVDENIVSAAKVRDAIAKKNVKILKDMLPYTTIDYLQQNKLL